MDIQRAYTTAVLLLDADQRLGIQTLFEQLASAFSNLRGQPQNPHLQSQVVEVRDRLTNALADLDQKLTPAQNLQIRELLGDDSWLFSHGVSDQIQDEMQRNAMAPAVIAQNVEGLRTKRAEVLQELTSLKRSFLKFHLAEADLAPGDAEISFLIPRALFDNRLDELAEEFDEINGIIGAFSEVVTGIRAGVEVRRISTSNPLLLVHVDPKTIVEIGKTITWLIATITGILKLRKLLQESEKELGTTELKEIFEKKIEERVDEAVKRRADEIQKLYPPNDESRGRELHIELEVAQKKLLFKIERGLNVEVRATLPTAE